MRERPDIRGSRAGCRCEIRVFRPRHPCQGLPARRGGPKRSIIIHQSSGVPGIFNSSASVRRVNGDAGTVLGADSPRRTIVVGRGPHPSAASRKCQHGNGLRMPVGAEPEPDERRNAGWVIGEILRSLNVPGGIVMNATRSTYDNDRNWRVSGDGGRAFDFGHHHVGRIEFISTNKFHTVYGGVITPRVIASHSAIAKTRQGERTSTTTKGGFARSWLIDLQCVAISGGKIFARIV
jgi:hypothetical protein